MTVTKCPINIDDTAFKDISSEVKRTYSFPNDQSTVIYSAEWLHVSKSGGHRILDARGNSHYIPKGWLKLTWESKEGSPPFLA